MLRYPCHKPRNSHKYSLKDDPLPLLFFLFRNITTFHRYLSERYLLNHFSGKFRTSVITEMAVYLQVLPSSLRTDSGGEAFGRIPRYFYSYNQL